MAALINAPRLVTLASLGHQWRHVADSDGPTQWLGDLSDRRVRDVFLKMRERGDIVTVRGRVEIYAKIAQGRSPADAHGRAKVR